MKPIKLRVIFMGTSYLAKEILNGLLREKYNIVSVYTKPDKKIGRNQKITESPVKSLAIEKKIRIFQPEKLGSEAIREIKDQKPDLIIVAAYGKILPSEILKIPGFKSLNVHVSLLPKYRGPSPIQNSLLSGEEETGTTIMLMDEGIDTGDILKQEKIKINKDETYPELSKRLSELSTKILLETIPLWIEEKIKPQKQNDAEATMCQLIEREDGKIIWSEDAEKIYNRYRAFMPWPGIHTFWETDKGFKRIKLNKIRLQKSSPQTKHHIGEVFQLGDKIGVQSGTGVIILEEIQIEGKANVNISDFLLGYKNFIGTVLK